MLGGYGLGVYRESMVSSPCVVSEGEIVIKTRIYRLNNIVAAGILRARSWIHCYNTTHTSSSGKV